MRTASDPRRGPGVPAGLSRLPRRPARRRSAFGRLLRDSRGGATIWSICWMLAFLVLGGVAIDAANAWRVRAQLLATVDAAALAGAMQLPDEEAAVERAVALAEVNMPRALHGSVVGAGDVEIGRWRGGVFEPGAEAPDAVRVVARRDHGRANAVPTYLLRLTGFDAWDMDASSVAVTRTIAGSPLCHKATILTEDFLQVGGNNTLLDGVCLHGEKGVHTGGNDFFGPKVRISAADLGTITINHVRPGSASREQIAVEHSRQAQVLPRLDGMFDALWSALYAGSAGYYSGDLLPDFVLDGTGRARIVRVNKGWWTVQPGELLPNTIYVVNHGMQLAGGVEARNVAIIAKGQIGVGGGQSLHFHDVFMFGSGDLHLAGNIMWGDPGSFCDAGRFNSYLFSRTFLSLGGFGNGGGVYGVVGAAPRLNLGGALRSAGGLYFEARQHTVLGGNATVVGCDKALDAEFGVVAGESQDGAAAGSRLVR